jgi:Tol biopolymer transport system component
MALGVSIAAVACSGGDDARPRDADPPGLALVGGFDAYVYTVDPEGRAERLSGKREFSARSLAWSPDGQRLAVLSEKVPQGRSQALKLIRTEGATWRLRSYLPGGVNVLRWPSRNRIELEERMWPSGVVVTHLDPNETGPPQTVRIEGPRRPVVSPDGRRRAVVRRNARGDQVIHVTRGDGTGAVNVSRAYSVGSTRLKERPCGWSRDSSRLAFLLQRGWGDELYVMTADGSVRHRLVSGVLPACPEWSPDGRMLAYVADVDDDGLDELRLVSGEGGPSRKLIELGAILDFDWRPGTGFPARVARRRKVSGTRAVRTAPILRNGTMRLENARLLERFSSDGDPERPTLADISPDGALVAVFRHHRLTVLDLRTGRRYLVGGAGRRYGNSARFSLDGRWLLYRRWDRLVAWSLDTRRATTIARAHWGSFAWLRDGRVVYSDGGQLKIVRPGEQPRAVAGVPHVTAFSITPDARRLLYDHRCQTFLLDRETGARRRLSGRMFTLPRSWAPDGSYFVLQSAEECDPEVGVTWAYHSSDTLYGRNGDRIVSLPGRGATWSGDSRTLFVYPQPTGSAVSGLEGLVAVDPIRMRSSTLTEEGNAESPAFVGPGGWVVFTRYDRPYGVPRNDSAGGLYLGRMVDR